MWSYEIYKQYLLIASGNVGFSMLKDDEYVCMKYCLGVTVYFSGMKFWGYMWPMSVIYMQYQCKHIRNSSSKKCNNSPQLQCISAGWNFEVIYDQWVWYICNISVNISEIVLQRNVITARSNSVFQQDEILRLYMTMSVIYMQYQCKHVRNSSSKKCNNSLQLQCISAGWNFEVIYDQWVWYICNIGANVSEIVLQRSVITTHNNSNDTL
jgi:hypothetical protein